MIAAVTTFFAVRNVILFLFDDHIAAFADDLHYLLDILYKLADNTDSCNILNLFLQLLHRHVFTLTFLENTGYLFDTSADLHDRAIQSCIVMFLDHMFKFDRQFIDRLPVRI